MSLYKYHGFTLIELVVVVVVVSILAAMSTQLITFPVISYLNLKRRTTLVDTADMTLRRMQRDIRRALPNSIRITSVTDGILLEMLHTSDGGRYRADADISISVPIQTTCTKDLNSLNLTDESLDFEYPPDACFEIMGNLTVFDPTATHGEFLFIYNASTNSQSAYLDLSNINSNRRVVKNSPDKNHIVIFPSLVPFPFESPNQLFAIVDTPVTYYCDLTTQQLFRYDHYSIQLTPAIPAVIGQLQANKLANCQFIYNGTAGLVSLEISLQDSTGDKVTLMNQVHVDNGL
jgi:MSHA biogenesis protein MshO